MGPESWVPSAATSYPMCTVTWRSVVLITYLVTVVTKWVISTMDLQVGVFRVPAKKHARGTFFQSWNRVSGFMVEGSIGPIGCRDRSLGG